MSAGWHAPAQQLIGCDSLGPWLAGRAERKVTVLVDEAVASAPVTARVRAQLDGGRHQVRVLALSGAGDLRTVAALADRLADTELVVGIGGGSLLDQAKLATLIRANPDAYARLTVPQRSGLLVLGPGTTRSLPLVAVPTTVGTGTEFSGVACLSYPEQGKRLVMGTALRPKVAVLDPVATGTLDDELIAEGVLEALFRVVSPYVGDHGDLPTEDALVETIAQRLVLLGHEVRDARRAGRPTDDRLRLEIAKLSGLSHAEWAHLGRDLYAVKGWLIANELSSALGVRKMTAVAAILPHLWRAITAGESRLGSAVRLERMWSRLRATGPDTLPADPAAGIEALIDSWRIGRTITAGPDRLAAVAGRTVRAWGAGLPMLGGLRTDDVYGLLYEAAA
ncbi:MULTISPECIES: daptide-type RiPP biosynthesis dehydogenase [unclassified Streptomyces]|uniref:daptide-type RiPP biosynthesis dehydogenase n=1 Tax=unclassified Streptomyces TaxID=2593676 RepID=UPI002E347594|nr:MULTISPECIES: daptide-type RiPP biosynthesis dehydogenase [unclassified Streptomyces]WUC65724.1 iron-containing alcohol dehydrogenase [Streptomyces sp. NBC_00539]